MADIWYPVLEDVLKVPDDVEVQKKHEEWCSLPRARDNLKDFEPNDTLEPRSPVSYRELRQSLMEMSGLSSTFYCITQRLMFQTIFIDDTDDWEGIADRLEKPLYNGIGSDNPNAGDIVVNLNVRTTNMTLSKQESLIRILKQCKKARSVTLCNFHPKGTPNILHSSSPIIRDLYKAMEDMSRTLQFLNLSLEIDSTALEVLLSVAGRMKYLHALFLYPKITVTCQHAVRIKNEVLPLLHTMGLDTSWGVHYALLPVLIVWFLPGLRSLLTRGIDALRGMDDFANSPNVPNLSNVSVDCPKVLAELIFPVCLRATSVMFPWQSTIFIGKYASVTEAYITGGVEERYFRDFEGWEMVAISRVMIQVLYNNALPSVRMVCLVDFDVEELSGYFWSPDVVTVWRMWCFLFEKRNIRFVDKDGYPLSTIPFDDVATIGTDVEEDMELSEEEEDESDEETQSIQDDVNDGD